MSTRKKGILTVLMMVVLLCSGCRTDENQANKTQSVDINKVMSSHTIVEIVDAPSTSNLSGEANVKITMPDINKIYMDLLRQGKVDTMTLEEICSAISEYAEEEDFLLTSYTTALVEQNSEEWELASDDCVEALIDDMVNDLFVKVINDVGVLEIETEDDFVWEGTQ